MTFIWAQNYGASLIIARQLDRAKDLFKLKLKESRKVYKKDQPVMLRIYECYGVCLKLERKLGQALKVFQKVASFREKRSGFGNRYTIACNKQMAQILIYLG